MQPTSLPSGNTADEMVVVQAKVRLVENCVGVCRFGKPAYLFLPPIKTI